MKQNKNPLSRKASPLLAEGCATAWKEFKAGYMDREVKFKGRDNEKKMTRAENLAEYKREKSEFTCKDGKIVMKKTDDAERPIED